MRREAALVTEAVGGRGEQRLGAPQRAAFLWGDAGEASGSSSCGLCALGGGGQVREEQKFAVTEVHADPALTV